jgi:hypothetical protein
MVRRVVATEGDEPGQQIRDMQQTLHQAELRLIGPVVATSPEALRHKPLVYSASSPSLDAVLSHLLNGSHYALRIDVSGANDAQRIPLDIVSTIILINFVNAGRRTAQSEDSTAGPTSRQPLPGVGLTGSSRSWAWRTRWRSSASATTASTPACFSFWWRSTRRSRSTRKRGGRLRRRRCGRASGRSRCTSKPRWGSSSRLRPPPGLRKLAWSSRPTPRMLIVPIIPSTLRA